MYQFHHICTHLYDFVTEIKQADTVLLGFPLMWDMPEDVRRNDLLTYQNVTDSNGPAMTWGMYSVGWMEMGDNQKADDFFNRSYSLYVREPFKVKFKN